MILFLRGFSALSSLILSSFVALRYSDEVFAQFALFLSAITLSSVIMRFGIEKTLVRHVSKLASNVDARQVVMSHLTVVLIWTLVCALPLFFTLKFVFALETSGLALVSACILSCLLFAAHILRSQKEISWSIILAGICVPVLTSLIIVLNGKLTIEALRFVYFGSLLLVTMLSVIILKLIYPYLIGGFEFEFPRFALLESIGALIHSFAVVGMQHLPVLIANRSLELREIAQLQYGLLFSMILGVLPLALSAKFEVEFSRTNGDPPQVLKKRRELAIAGLRYFAVMSPLAFMAGVSLVYLDIVKSALLLIVMMIGQLFNLIALQYQAESLMIWNVKNATFASILAVLVVTAILFSISCFNWHASAVSFGTAITGGYIAKFAFLFLTRKRL